MQAWFGKKIKELRSSLQKFDFSKGCQRCAYFILNNMEKTSVINLQEEMGFDKDVGKVFPSQLIFQLHNTCNYECIMCSGEYSSSIRKNRDNLPAKHNVYDKKFADSMITFIKHARVIEFIGGEPFLVSVNYELLNHIVTHNPNCRVAFVTNGSVYNSKIEKILKQLPNVDVCVSIDSINPDTYALIRKNGSLKNVLNNIANFQKICSVGSIAVCPIIQNIYEMHDIINYCKSINVDLWINTVEGSLGSRDVKRCSSVPEFRLQRLSTDEKQRVKKYLLSQTHPDKYQQKLKSLIEFIDL